MAPTFASAAASGNNSSSSRADGASDWPRRANGSTQTFRRTSQATTASNPSTANSSARESNSNSTPQPRNSSDGNTPYIPPHMNTNRNGAGGDLRYSKDRFLEIFKVEKDAGNLIEGVDGLYIGGFHPSASNGVAGATWGRREEHKENHSVDLCWDRNARMFPMSLQDMTDEERDLFTSSVNSPIKPPTLTNKDGTPKDASSHRKTSISQSLNSPGPYGLASPTQVRPGNRRRDTSESYPFPETSLASPSTARFSREGSAAAPPAALLRRRTEQKESISEQVEEQDRDRNEPAPSGGLKRSATGGLGVTSPATWGSQSNSTFSPMGSFGNFALGSGGAQQPLADKRSGYGSVRGQSRFAGLMKDSSADADGYVREKGSISDLQRQSEPEQERSWMEQRQNRPYSEDTDPYPENDMPTGSAALGGGLDDSPPKPRGYAPFGGSKAADDGGFSMLGMTSDNVGHHDFSHQTPQHTQHRNDLSHEPMSPTNTNPYQSPENERIDSGDYDHDPHDMPGGPLPGLGGFRSHQSQGLPGLGSNFPGFGGRIPQTHEIAASDRSQTSSTGPARGFPSLSGFGGLPGLGGASPWSGGPQGTGTPTRDRAGFGGAFGEGAFTSGADMQSPVLAGLGGGSGPFSAGGFGGGRSKMGSLFPSAMQEQMRMGEGGHGGSEEQSFDPFSRQHAGISGLGRGPLGSGTIGSAGPARHESPFRNNQQAMFDDLMDQTPRNEMPSAIGDPSGMFSQLQGGSSHTPLSAASGQDALGLARKSQSNLQRQGSVASPSTSQPPLQQMRTMVMPDRMRWIYKDPQGSTQGPWSGLEMHDWYRAGFFTPELLIKRVEDPEFEPLAQLIRRIGNSREPFLVPQIGVPHDGPVSGSKSQTGPTGVQPPFPNSFPSFGTTLTAEQQNALERRKQEEQFLMARQKEHLAQQQMYIKQQMGMPSGSHGMMSGQLHHHSSAHSLHSQPSFGSVTSPPAYQPSPVQGPVQGGSSVPGFFDNAFRQVQGGQGGADVLGSIRESEIPGMMERLNLTNNRGQQVGGQQFPLGQGLPDDMQSAQIAAMLQDRARLQREQAEHDQMRRESGQSEEEQEALAAQERFQQFHDLRQQEQDPAEMLEEHEAQLEHEHRLREMAKAQQEAPPEETLTQQVQAASAAKQASAQAAQQSPWAKIDPVHAESIQHPGQSASPMPAPIAQRKHIVADNLVAEARSATQSPAVETPTTSVAPWANQTGEVPKTLSLKEIQEAEAKRAAKQEEAAAAQRRALYERELAAAQAAQNIPPAPGLPTGATWASQSPAAPTGSSMSAWGAKTPGKPGSKTLQQIQKEEEAKKQRAAAQAAAVQAPVAPGPILNLGGKRYADLAGKSTSPAVPAGPPGSWTTVGAGGKVKAAAPSPTAPAPTPGRSVSGVVPTVGKPSPVARSTTMGASQLQKLTKVDALGEFKKWAALELQRGGLHPSINPSDFIDTLLVIGSEVDILTEAVHGSAQTIDSRHFAEEFVRRKKQADKGIIVEAAPSPVAAKAGENAWNAVAKKSGGAMASPTAAVSTPSSGEFKVAKAKGRRK